MGVGTVFKIPTEAKLTWQSKLRQHGIRVTERLEHIAERDRDVGLSTGVLHFVWGDRNFDIQTFPVDTPLSNPQTIEYYLMTVYYKNSQDKRQIEAAIEPIFRQN